MFHFSTAETALRTSQVGLDIVANNIANANTPGYHRQVLRQSDRRPIEINNLLIGTGVEAKRIDRILDQATEAAILSNISANQAISPRIDVMRQIETVLTASDTALRDKLQAFWDELQELNLKPSDPSQRSIFLRTAQSLAEEIAGVASALDGMSQGIDGMISDAVSDINTLTRQISQLNRQITVAEAHHRTPNDLYERRDVLVSDLAQLADVNVHQGENAGPIITFGGGVGLIEREPRALRMQSNEQGNLEVVTPDGVPIQPTSGRLAGLFSVDRQLIQDYRSNLMDFATTLANRFNELHVSGIGTGPFSILTSANRVSDVTAPLADEVAPNSMVADGEIFLRTVNRETGEASLTRIAVDPASASLEDLAQAISQVDRVQAIVNSSTGRISILAEEGFSIDFSGGPSTQPSVSTLTGDSTVSIFGNYTGDVNEQFTITVEGTGTVGLTPGLKLNIVDGAGEFVASLDVGLGYEAGSQKTIASNLSLSLSAGQLNDGESFSVDAVARGDSTGLLTALGINTFFVGDASDFRVDQRLTDDPTMLATSGTGESGDNRNVRSLMQLRDRAVMNNETETFESFLGDLIARTGIELRGLEETQTTLAVAADHLENERQRVSGVEPNEELIRMLEFQRSFEAASRLLATMNDLLDELMRVVR